MNRSRALVTKKRMARESPKQQERRLSELAARQTVAKRSGSRCEVVLESVWAAKWRCTRRAVDFHHIVKVSQGGRGKGIGNLIHLCRFHHDLTDAAPTHVSTAVDGEKRRGRLVIEPDTLQCALATAATQP